mmetsp:Transcript_18202/g.43868  ORF Transcript_18202/g.43868 Transcript_18202/m.43868 type:complete len:202 (-) Transcript_18202:672-1277(-)
MGRLLELLCCLPNRPHFTRESDSLLCACEALRRSGCCDAFTEIVEGVRILAVLGIGTGLRCVCAQITIVTQGLQGADESLDSVPFAVPVRLTQSIGSVLGLDLGDQSIDPRQIRTLVLQIATERALGKISCLVVRRANARCLQSSILDFCAGVLSRILVCCTTHPGSLGLRLCCLCHQRRVRARLQLCLGLQPLHCGEQRS